MSRSKSLIIQGHLLKILDEEWYSIDGIMKSLEDKNNHSLSWFEKTTIEEVWECLKELQDLGFLTSKTTRKKLSEGVFTITTYYTIAEQEEDYVPICPRHKVITT